MTGIQDVFSNEIIETSHTEYIMPADFYFVCMYKKTVIQRY